jgi:rhamnosyltransferase
MVSVIIPTLNAESTVERLLSALNEQTVRHETIVIDSSSSDKTGEIAEAHGVHLIRIRREDFNHGRTRNLAATWARGEILVFLTQDAIPLDMLCIENLIKPLSEDSVAASYGRQLPKNDATPTEKFARYYNYPERASMRTWEDVPNLGIKAFFFSNVCSAIRTKQFTGLGRFPEELIMFEDMLFAAQLVKSGYKIAYVPDAKVIHSHDYTWREQFIRYRHAGMSFRDNPWFLRFGKADGEGLKFLTKEIVFLAQNRMHRWIPCALVESVYKYAGYKAGLHLRRFKGVR